MRRIRPRSPVKNGGGCLHSDQNRTANGSGGRTVTPDRCSGITWGYSAQDVQLERSATGKPLISGRQELAFSLAHCETHAVIAVASHALVGVDVEHHHSVNDALGISRRYFAREEADVLDRQAPQELDAAFLRLWVCKEAFIKAIGLGLSYPLDRVIVGGFDGEHPYYRAIDEPHGLPLHWTLTLIERERSYIAIAVKTLSQQTSPQ